MRLNRARNSSVKDSEDKSREVAQTSIGGHCLRILYSILLFVLCYMPASAIVGVLEGGVRGEWGLSGHDWVYQLGAFAAFIAPSLLILAPFAGASVYATIRILQRRRLDYPLAWVAVFGPLVMFTVFFAVCVAGAIVADTPWWWPLVLLHLPVAFVGGAAAYSVAIALVARKYGHGHAA